MYDLNACKNSVDARAWTDPRAVSGSVPSSLPQVQPPSDSNFLARLNSEEMVASVGIDAIGAVLSAGACQPIRQRGSRNVLLYLNSL